jgi:glycosyltransferase involved in cell wall biosynthesis
VTTPVVSVVVPVLDAAGALPACLDCLAAQEGAPGYEVLVVDNGSTDATVAVAAGHPVGPRLLHEPVRGPYAARNTGIAAAEGRIVAFTDADCRPEPAWLAVGVAAIERGADLVGGRIVQLHRDRPTVWERYDRATYLNQERFVSEQGFAATANLFVRAEVLAAVGPFKPELVASGDLELGQRATAAGYGLVYAEDARVGHQPRTTLRDTWALHRKLGSGFAELARAGVRESPWRDLGLRVPFEVAVAEVNADGPPLRRRQLLPAHAVAMSARWVGRVTGRG